jgi:hypothetical protein
MVAIIWRPLPAGEPDHDSPDRPMLDSYAGNLRHKMPKKVIVERCVRFANAFVMEKVIMNCTVRARYRAGIASSGLPTGGYQICLMAIERDLRHALTLWLGETNEANTKGLNPHRVDDYHSDPWDSGRCHVARVF